METIWNYFIKIKNFVSTIIDIINLGTGFSYLVLFLSIIIIGVLVYLILKYSIWKVLFFPFYAVAWLFTLPDNFRDTDGDGIPDRKDKDADGDGILDKYQPKKKGRNN